MKRKLVISLAVFFSLLIIGTVGTNVYAYGSAPSWHPVNGDINDWDLRWEGTLNSSFTNVTYGYFANITGNLDAWGQIWTKNATPGPGLDAAALVFLVDLHKNCWDKVISQSLWDLVIAPSFGSMGNLSTISQPYTVWKLFAWLVNASVNSADINFTVSEYANPGYDHGLVINGTYNTSIIDAYVEVLIATEGGGLVFGVMVDPVVNENYLEDLGIANTTEDVYQWLESNVDQFIAMAQLMLGFMASMMTFSIIIGTLSSFGILSTNDIVLSSSDAQSQTELAEIGGDVSASASAKGFGYIATSTPPIPGFEIWYVLVPISILAFYVLITKKKRIQHFP
ncbi:MAG: hypothetical protein ACTSVY_13495 [Candidatus Helarchaeota archaeon]